MSTTNPFSAWLIKRQEELGLTNAALGRLIGVSGETIRKYRSEGTVPGSDKVAALAKALDVPQPELWHALEEASGRDRPPMMRQTSIAALPGGSEANRTIPPHRLPEDVKSFLRIVPITAFHRRPATAEPRPEYVGHAVRDSRAISRYDDGAEVPDVEDYAVPSASLKQIAGLAAGDRIDVEPCDRYIASGLYIVYFGSQPELWQVDSTPEEGFRFRNDFIEHYVDPDPESPTGLVSRTSGRPVRITFARRVLRVSQSVAHPFRKNSNGNS